MDRKRFLLLRSFLIILSICKIFPVILFAEELQVNSEKSELFIEAKSLYLELLQFKDNKKFHEIGFDRCCQFNKWLVKAESLRDHPNGIDLVLEGFLPGDLEKLGRAYLKSHGKDTEYIIKETQKFRQIFNLLEDDEYKPNSGETISGAKNFEKIVFKAFPQFKSLISFFDISYRDGHLIVYIKKAFLGKDSDIQNKIFNGINDLWQSTNLVKDKHYSTLIEIKYQDVLTGETTTIVLD